MHVSFYTRCCAVCGKDLIEGGWLAGGHVRVSRFANSLKHVLYATCPEHHDQEANSIIHNTDGDLGYRGEWEPRLGLIAEVSTYVEGQPIKRDRIKIV